MGTISGERRETSPLFYRLRLVAAGFAIGFYANGAAGQVATTVTVDAPRTLLVGDTVKITATVHYVGAPCPATLPPTPGSLLLKGGAALGDYDYPFTPISRQCVNGTYSEGTDFFVNPAVGDYAYAVAYTGGGGLAPSDSGPIALTIVPYLSGSLRKGEARLSVARPDGSGFFCQAHQASFDPGDPGNGPPAISFADGFVRYAFARCGYGCGFLCPPGVPKFPQQVVTLEMPQPLDASSSLWVYAPGGGMTTSVWRRLDATIDGSRATFILNGNDGDVELRGILAVGAGDGARSELQDIWWGGAQENGWGVSLAQIGDRLVGVLFVYRDNGTPVWVIMPGGTWDASRTAFSGNLVGFGGSWFGDYHASRLFGTPVGSARFTISGPSSAMFDYTIGVVSGRKAITRLPLSATTTPGPYAGLWWAGSAKTGWGLAVGHQDSTLVAIWYTYDQNGAAVWFVMPGGTLTSIPGGGTRVTGTLYRATGSSWLGTTYDPAKLVLIPAGTLNFSFDAPDIARMTWAVDGVTGGDTIYKAPF